MNKFSIAVLAAVTLVSFGCKKKSGSDYVAKMTGFRDKICACPDKACADKVGEEMSKWSQDQVKSSEKGPQMSDDDIKKTTALGDEIAKCISKVSGPVTGSGSAAAPPAGSEGSAATPPAGSEGSAAGTPPPGSEGSAAGTPPAGSGAGSAAPAPAGSAAGSGK